MCIPYRQLDPKARRLRVIANISLVLGLTPWLFLHPSSQIALNWLDGVCGFLLGLSITINLLGFRLARRCDARSSGVE